MVKSVHLFFGIPHCKCLYHAACLFPSAPSSHKIEDFCVIEGVKNNWLKAWKNLQQSGIVVPRAPRGAEDSLKNLGNGYKLGFSDPESLPVKE